MVSEDHFVTPEDRVIGFILIGSMRIVPDAAGTSDDEDTDGLNESVAPECAEEEDVEVDESVVGEIADAGEDVAWSVAETCGRDQVDENIQADCPHTESDGCLDDGN